MLRERFAEAGDEAELGIRELRRARTRRQTMDQADIDYSRAGSLACARRRQPELRKPAARPLIDM
jgi:hypothetical protein